MARKKKVLPLPEGFTCACGKTNKYPLYVYAHWLVDLRLTCECGRCYVIYAGKAEEIC